MTFQPGVVLPITPYIRPNEMVDFVSETDLPTPEYTEPHRYQLIGVLRDQMPHIYRRDMGLAALFKDPGFTIMTAYAHSAQEATELADEKRGEQRWLKNFLIEQAGESTLNADLERTWDERKKSIKSESTYGPVATVQRGALRKSAIAAKEQA